LPFIIGLINFGVPIHSEFYSTINVTVLPKFEKKFQFKKAFIQFYYSPIIQFRRI